MNLIWISKIRVLFGYKISDLLKKITEIMIGKRVNTVKTGCHFQE